MDFQTYTCVVCGKTGLTKRNSYQYAFGRACRAHEQVFSEAARRNHPEEFDEKLKAKYFVEKCIKQKKIDLPTSCHSFDIVAIVWIIEMLTAVEHTEANTPEFIREMISRLKETPAYEEATHWYLDQYVEILEGWNPQSDLAFKFTDLIGKGRDQLVRIQADMKSVGSYKQEGLKIWKLVNELVRNYDSNIYTYTQYSRSIIDILKRRISLTMCIDNNDIVLLNKEKFDKQMDYLSFIVKIRTAIRKKDTGLRDSVFIDILNCVRTSYCYLFV